MLVLSRDSDMQRLRLRVPRNVSVVPLPSAPTEIAHLARCVGGVVSAASRACIVARVLCVREARLAARWCRVRGRP